ncbi:hypothetical protein CI238_00738 [Colletotrichum incanum]|uniref:Uncharacterized protein n=1 Tax=Colletotrichum incanum TaxID=1573173 RepID=A0A161VFC0_COLIC|nr:hypothetical protein CI238_00738 [Colletotrichum incanum]
MSRSIALFSNSEYQISLQPPNMKFVSVVIGLFAALAIAAPAVESADALEARAEAAVNELVARQIWQCNCVNHKNICCGPLGACYTGKC